MAVICELRLKGEGRILTLWRLKSKGHQTFNILRQRSSLLYLQLVLWKSLCQKNIIETDYIHLLLLHNK